MKTLDFSAFQNKPIKSTATPFDFSQFQQTPIKSTAKPLDFKALQSKPSLIPKLETKALTEEYKVPERTPVAQQDFKDVANMVIELGAIVPQAITSTVQSFREAKAGKALEKYEIPLFKDQKLVIQGVQRNYEDRLNAGQSDREAFIGSSFEFGLDLAFTIGSMKSVARKALLKTPEKLVTRQVIADTKTVRDYVAGRSNYLGVEVPQELKTAWSKLPSDKKKEVLKGVIQLEKIVPNRLAKILGVTEAEITKLVPKERIIAEERRLPGYATEGKPAFGLSIEPRKPVGFGDKNILPKETSIIEEAKLTGAKRISPDRVIHQQITPQQSIQKIIETDKELFNKGKELLNKYPYGIRVSKKLINQYKEIEEKIEKGIATEATTTWYNKIKKQMEDAIIFDDIKTKTGDKDFFRKSNTTGRLDDYINNLTDKNISKKYIDLIKKDISKGYKFPNEVLNYDKSFKTAINNRERYEKGLRTSFGADDQRIIFEDVETIGAGMKRQDGKELTELQKSDIREGVIDFSKTLGLDMKKLAKDDRWVYVHLNEKNPFLMKDVAGLYRKDITNKSVSISVGGKESYYVIIDGERVKKFTNTTMAHELGHAIDFKIGEKFLSGDEFLTLRRNYNPIENSFRGEKYWSSKKEVTARMLEEYIAVEKGNNNFFDKQGYWKKYIFEKNIKPVVESNIKEKFSEYKLTKPTIQQEAKKYNSADEFVEAQTPIFRGTEKTPTRIQGMTDEYTGTAFSRNREVAQNYGDNMFVKYLSENEILKAGDLPKDTLKELRSELRKLPSILETGDLIETENLISKVMKIAEQNNKKATDIASIFPSMAEESEIRLIGGLGDAPTKSQLKDIWEKAQVTSKEIPQKKLQIKPTVKSEAPETDFLVQNSLTKSVEQKVQDVKKIKEGLDPVEVKEIKQIPEKTIEVLERKSIEPKFLSPNEAEYLDQKRMELIFIEDQIANHPAKTLKKYFSYKIGALPEVTGKGTSIFAKKGDDVVTELGYHSSEEARQDIHNLFTLEERVKDLKTEIKDLSLIEKDEIALNKLLRKRPIKIGKTVTVLEDSFTTRKIKQRPHYQSFVKYAEKYITRDIHPPILNRHITMTAERVAEYLDEGIGGRVYREIVKPVYKSAVDMTKELHTIKTDIKKFKIIEGSVNDRDASLFAQGKLDDTSHKSKELARYSRQKYDEWLVRMNERRAKMGVEPIRKRKDYITHLNEVNVLTELLGGVDRITVKHRISSLKNEMLDRDANLSQTVAFERAKREIEGTTGLDMYIDARQPIFKYAKRRLGEYEKNPSVIRSVDAYARSAMRYIYQAENVAKNKAYKDALPANAKEFFRLWNTEQVAGRTPSSVMNPMTKRVVNSIRGTLGANTILGNMATTVMQLTSFPQVVALAGARNTMYGIVTRLSSYLSKSKGTYSLSRTKTLRNLDIDIGMGNSLVDSLLIKVGEMEKARNTVAYTRLSVDFGRRMLMGIMETADQFTVGASFEAFQRKAILDGVKPEKALEYADIMTGKTQANYYKEALPPFLNTVGGKVLGQFGTYSFNQWEMFTKDFGKALKLDKKSPKEVKLLFKHFIFALVGAYLVDMVSEDVFGRQPFDIKDLVDEGIAMTQGKTDVEHLVEQGKETVLSYIPFMGSIKFGSMPPVLDFGSDLIQFGFGNDEMKVAKAKKDLQEKWSLSVLMPYGGNQVRKTLQGIEFEDESDIEKTKALLFGKWATEQGQQYFEDIKQREISKNKIEKAVENEDYSKLSEEDITSTTTRNALRDKYSIVGAITSEENIQNIQELSKEEQEILIGTYAETTQKTIRKKLEKPNDQNTLESIFNKEQTQSLESIFK